MSPRLLNTEEQQWERARTELDIATGRFHFPPKVTTPTPLNDNEKAEERAPFIAAEKFFDEAGIFFEAIPERTEATTKLAEAFEQYASRQNEH